MTCQIKTHRDEMDQMMENERNDEMEELYFCGDLNERLTPEEKKLLPHLKRFFECFMGMPSFKTAIEQQLPSNIAMLEAWGIRGIDLSDVYRYMDEHGFENDVSGLSEAYLESFPQINLWLQWQKATLEVRDNYIKQPFKANSEDFNAWRERQVKRCKSQMPKKSADAIIHAPLAFELSDGCSRNCPFCGLASEPLRGVYANTEANRHKWQEVIQTLQRYFGEETGKGVCYWATEPSDNADYTAFLNDFGGLTGQYPQTTTAVAAHRIAWIKGLLANRASHPRTAADRFSVLSEKEFRSILENYTAEELFYVDLILQYSEGRMRGMAFSGRNKANRDQVAEDEEVLEDHTIACLSGYLINMVLGTIKLITPCPPSEANPLGYITLSEGTFDSADDVAAFIDKTVEAHMSQAVFDYGVVKFREDIAYASLPDGFKLNAKYKAYQYKGEKHLADLGALIASSTYTLQEITSELMARKYDVFKVIYALDQLKREGLLTTN
jgi:radical SAM family RiPP maturation amino acid epimerase